MQGMRDMLRGSLGRSLKEMTPLDRLAAAWPVACGRAMAERGEITGFSEGVIRVEVTDQVWLRQMESMRGVLEHDLARIAGVKASGIHFEVKRSG
jgi:hypothetical protein